MAIFIIISAEGSMAAFNVTLRREDSRQQKTVLKLEVVGQFSARKKVRLALIGFLLGFLQKSRAERLKIIFPWIL